MSIDTAIFTLALAVQTTALGFFAGKVHQMLKDHERRLGDLE